MRQQFLSHKGYNGLRSFKPIEDSEIFYSLLYKASDVLAHLTQHFYQTVAFESDDEHRKTAYKKALACQVEYFYETGEQTSMGLNSQPLLVNMGRTTVEMMQQVDKNGATLPKAIVCPDIYIYLDGTGLLDGSVAS